VDEASMVGTRLLHDMIRHLDAAGGSLVLMGDPDQHGSVEAGGMYAHLLRSYRERVVTLNANNRQTDEVERLSIREFQQGRVQTALEQYERAGKVIRCKTAAETYDRMVDD
jgi:ATP-dependent exoDNAse (exonuclease V) alpha subunit